LASLDSFLEVEKYCKNPLELSVRGVGSDHVSARQLLQRALAHQAGTSAQCAAAQQLMVDEIGDKINQYDVRFVFLLLCCAVELRAERLRAFRFTSIASRPVLLGCLAWTRRRLPSI
jgi:hypothetical protein